MGLAPTSRCLQGSIAPVAHALPSYTRKDEHHYRSFAPVAAGFHRRNVSVFRRHTSLTIKASQVAKR